MKNTFVTRMIAGVASLAAASVVLSGCLYAQIPDYTAEPTPDVQPTPGETAGPDLLEGIAADLLPFYEQTVEWEECDGGRAGFDCALITSPLDWDNPSAGELEIAIVRHQANREAMGSLLVNPGGPGGSGWDFIYDSLDYAVGKPLADSYDVIGFDPRGVGRSTPVTCLDPKEKDVYLYSIPEAERGTEEWEEELSAGHKDFADACERNSGGTLEHITTVNSARDMDLIRVLMGDTQLNYLGYSYGTFLGSTYAEIYPDKVGRLVLDAAIDPSVPSYEVGIIQATGFESALRAFVEDCLDSGDCPFSGTVDDGISDIQALLASIERKPLPGYDDRMLGADTAVTGIIFPLYNDQNWPYLLNALEVALEGDGSELLWLADIYNGRDQYGDYEDNSTEAFRAYNCMDYPADDDEAGMEEAMKRLEEEAPTFAPYWQGPSSCEQWPYEPSGNRDPKQAKGAGPILVIGTTNDPATPYEWSVALAEQLESGILITREGEGHAGYGKGNVCVDTAVEEYFLEDIVPSGDLDC